MTPSWIKIRFPPPGNLTPAHRGRIPPCPGRRAPAPGETGPDFTTASADTPGRCVEGVSTGQPLKAAFRSRAHCAGTQVDQTARQRYTLAYKTLQEETHRPGPALQNDLRLVQPA